MKEYRILVISSYVIGICLGILMGLLSVFIISETISVNSFILWLLEIIVYIFLPLCILITKKLGYSFLIISLVMALISFGICLIYANIMRNSALEYQATTTIFKDIMIKAAIGHTIFIILSVIIHFVEKKKLKDSDDK